MLEGNRYSKRGEKQPSLKWSHDGENPARQIEFHPLGGSQYEEKDQNFTEIADTQLGQSGPDVGWTRRKPTTGAWQSPPDRGPLLMVIQRKSQEFHGDFRSVISIA